MATWALILAQALHAATPASTNQIMAYKADQLQQPYWTGEMK